MISKERKQKIIDKNQKLGLKTMFIQEEDILGYSLGNTIYLNESMVQEIERTNNHELLHFFTDTKEFQIIKKYLYEKYKKEIDQSRDSYYLKYFGLYSEEEIKSGVIEEEIVIDLLINNFSIEIESTLKVGEILFESLIQNIEQKRYLNLSIKSNIANMNLSKWEKIFVTNYYDGVQHKIPTGEKYQGIREEIFKELKRLYSFTKEDFQIDSNSPEILREYESELKAMSQRGEDTNYFVSHKQNALKELSKNFTEHLYEEYMHIVNFLKGNSNYEDAFKVVMLRETLLKVYKMDKIEGKTNTIVKKREMHKSISGHMTLANDTILKIIYEYVEDYSNFANLYFAALEVYVNHIMNQSEIRLDGVETYGKGKWIKFDGKSTNEAEYIENSKRLAALVQDTPWCTKTLASTQLTEGDFFVFVDLEGKPHIAVKMSGNEIDEVRGILNGNAQELEPDYREVALSFLENNQDIQHGKEWLEKEEWNKRLLLYIQMIENKTFTQEMVPDLIKDYFKIDYKSHFGINTNKQKLSEKLPLILDKIAAYYHCTPEEICLGDYNAREGYQLIDGEKVCPYLLIFGDADFGDSEITSLGKLQRIGGNADFSDSQIVDLGQLQSIGGVAYFRDSPIRDLGNLQYIGGKIVFNTPEQQQIYETEFKEGKRISQMCKKSKVR